MIIERTPVSDRIPLYGDIYELWIESEKRVRNLEEENRRLNAALQSYTRTVVENNILKEKIKEMEEEMTWAGLSQK